MGAKSGRWRQFTLAGLMAAVAGSAVLFALLRPTAEATAMRAADELLQATYPGPRYRVTGITKKGALPGYDWMVTFGNLPGNGTSTTGWIYVDGRGKASMGAMFTD